MSETLITGRQVAELLGVSAETVLRWTRRGWWVIRKGARSAAVA